MATLRTQTDRQTMPHRQEHSASHTMRIAQRCGLKNERWQNVPSFHSSWRWREVVPSQHRWLHWSQYVHHMSTCRRFSPTCHPRRYCNSRSSIFVIRIITSRSGNKNQMRAIATLSYQALKSVGTTSSFRHTRSSEQCYEGRIWLARYDFLLVFYSDLRSRGRTVDEL